MARKRVVSRTIKVLVTKALCVNTDTKEAYEQTNCLIGKYKNEDAILKAITELLPEGHKAVSIYDADIVNVLYAMPEEEFVKYAAVVEKEEAANMAVADPDAQE